MAECLDILQPAVPALNQPYVGGTDVILSLWVVVQQSDNILGGRCGRDGAGIHHWNGCVEAEYGCHGPGMHIIIIALLPVQGLGVNLNRLVHRFCPGFPTFAQ